MICCRTSVLFLAVLCGGCTTVRTTDPPRTATEQFLLSTATTLAVEQLSIDALRGRSVYVDSSYLSVIDQAFIIGEIRAHLLMAGAKIAAQRDQAEAVIEVRSGGSGVDRYEFLLGIPALPLGSMASAAGMPAVALTSPELALIKRVRQWGFTGVALVAYWRGTGEVIAASGPFVGRSHREDWWFFGMGPKSISNIPTTEPLE
jgi:hypothetical protein